MSKYLKQAVLGAAVALVAVAAPAFAQAPAHVSSSSSNLTADGWGNLGVTIFHVSSDFGGVSSTQFGVHAGGDVGVRLTDSLSGVGIADLAVNFGGDLGTVVPIFLGGGIKIDKSLPVDITAGLGLVLVTGITGTTPVGLGILGQAYYPLPSMPQVGVGGQVQIHILSDSLTDFSFNAGVKFTFM
jgi:hypothetical protein